MQSKNWGAFLCDCRSTLNVDQKKIGAPVPLVKVVTNPEEEIHTFAKEAEQQNIDCLLYTSPSPRDQRGSRMPASA